MKKTVLIIVSILIGLIVFFIGYTIVKVIFLVDDKNNILSGNFASNPANIVRKSVDNHHLFVGNCVILQESLQETDNLLTELDIEKSRFIAVNQKINQAPIFKATAYDLSFQSTGKSQINRGYGITRNATDLKDKQWHEARTIAVDPKLIPLGSKVYLQFIDPAYGQYNGVWNADDTGGAINGYRIDMFLGDFKMYRPDKTTIDFGITDVKVLILE